MKKVAVVAALAFASVGAHAESWFSIEAGFGVSSYTREGPGIYYSPGFKYSAPVNAFAFRVGVVSTVIDAKAMSFVPGLRIHADYLNFGGVNWSASSPQDASDFTMVGKVGGYDPKAKACINHTCGQMSDFESFGRIQAFALTLEPYWQLRNGWTVGVEAGPALYRDTWVTHATVTSNDGTGKLGPIGTVHNLTTEPKLHVGAVVGASVSKGPFSVRYTYIFARQSQTGVQDWQSPSGVKGAHMLTLNYTY
jgi:hypothetical protein